jgi:enamine deaminase RidA (YjgF/YER057c/UK114 family)
VTIVPPPAPPLHKINPPELPRPRGFSHAVAGTGTFVFVSGQIATDHMGKVTTAGLLLQARQALRNVRTVLAEAGGAPEHIAQMTWYVLDVDLAVDRVVAYRAAAVERLSGKVMREISRNRIDAAVFLSARTAAIFCNLVIASGTTDACARMTAVAISRKVGAALHPAGFGQVVAAETPHLDGVVDAVLRIASEGVGDPQGD